jgi:hypothetical protein
MLLSLVVTTALLQSGHRGVYTISLVERPLIGQLIARTLTPLIMALADEQAWLNNFPRLCVERSTPLYEVCLVISTSQDIN